MISLRVFTVSNPPGTPLVLRVSEQAHLLFVRKVTDQAPHLEYFAVLWDVNVYHWKRVHGEWAPCNRAEFPSHGQLR